MKQQFPFDLAAIDVDGTLLGPALSISADNRAAVLRLQQAGVRVVLASGRWHGDILPFHRQLGLTGCIVSSQGAMVKHAETGKTLQSSLIDSGTARRVVSSALERDLTVICYRADRVVASGRSAWTEREEHCLQRRVDIAGGREDLYRSVLKIICCGPADILATFEPTVSTDLTHLTSHPEWFEFYAASASKATALSHVARTASVPPERIATFGDGDNDAPMLTWAGLGVAMAHGSLRAREAARFVAPDGSPETCLSRAVDMLAA